MILRCIDEQIFTTGKKNKKQKINCKIIIVKIYHELCIIDLWNLADALIQNSYKVKRNEFLYLSFDITKQLRALLKLRFGLLTFDQ